MNKANPDKKDKGKSLQKKKSKDNDAIKLDKLIDKIKSENEALQKLLEALNKGKKTDD